MEIRLTTEMLETNIRLLDEKLRETDPANREFVELTDMLAELRRARSEISNDFGWVAE